MQFKKKTYVCAFFFNLKIKLKPISDKNNVPGGKSESSHKLQSSKFKVQTQKLKFLQKEYIYIFLMFLAMKNNVG